MGGNEESLLFANPANMEVLEKKFHFTDTFRANNLQIFLDLIRLEIKDCKVFYSILYIYVGLLATSSDQGGFREEKNNVGNEIQGSSK